MSTEKLKFTIIIPTQNRPELIALSVHYALTQNYKNIELIVSDNSTTVEFKEQTRLKLKPHIDSGKLLLVSPPVALSAPDHFEFALQYAKGDYVLYLTDKMMLLPNTLVTTEAAIAQSGAEIVNWTYFSFITDDYLNPSGSGCLTNTLKTHSARYMEYDPLRELSFKASGLISRINQPMESYVKGKLCFGCYSMALISRITKASGALFNGSTHDYSSMVQALCVCKKCVILDSPGVVFVTIPVDKSWGTLTHFQASGALLYYQSFRDPERMIRSLFVPGLYASSHNMVAHDYVKYLGFYGKRELFIEKFWLRSIGRDLFLADKIWSSESERQSHHDIFFTFLNKKLAYRIHYYLDRALALRRSVFNGIKSLVKKAILILGPFGKKQVLKRHQRLGFSVTPCPSLDTAVKLIAANYSTEHLEKPSADPAP